MREHPRPTQRRERRRSGLDPLRGRLGEHAGLEKGDRQVRILPTGASTALKIHLLTERTGKPISVGVSAANLHDSQALIPLAKRHTADPLPSRRQTAPAGQAPRRQGLRLPLPAARVTRAWHHPPHRRRGVEPSQRLGRRRRTIERTMSWLAGCRRLHRRYERKAEHFLAFTAIACTLICYRRLTK
ncbi:transposase [Streptomyces sp. NBC_01077]|uniref:transposase n=1 Tax=Streptomyces sp. NBC_01077 TaxID=2903746 RepID=UPI003868A332